MRRIISFAVWLPLAAQETPVPSEEQRLKGSIDLGYRWRTDLNGNLDAYRSIVNLGSGPKLLGSEFTVTDPQHRWFDQIKVRAYSWGDEPYSTFHLDAGKSKWYRFGADYRDIAYFNSLPSYADPLLSRGIVLNEQSFDTRRRFGSFSLDLLPTNWIVPYIAFDRDSGSGRGVTTFVSNSNEYPVPDLLRDSTNLYRGGVRIERRRFHVTLEEGGATFKDDQSVFQNPGSTNFGNVATPIAGQRLNVTSLLAAYGVRGTGTYSKGLVTASPASWLDLYGQYLFSQPVTDVNYQQTDTGNLLLLSQFLFYNSERFLVSSSAKLPHTTASAGAEIRPLRRIRIVESWMTDRLHTASSASGTQLVIAQSSSQQMASLLASSLATNYNQQQIDVFFDALSRLTLRGGYRYVWGDARQLTLPAQGLASSDSGKLRRNVALAGFTYRPGGKVSVSTDTEVASGEGAYFRTSLFSYQKIRAQARYQALASLSFAGDFTYLNNENPNAGARYEFHDVQGSLSFLYSPAGGKFGNFNGSYSRADLRSTIGYLVPQDLSSQFSIYRDRAHLATALFDFHVPRVKITAGGSMVVSSGSRPTRYYQPRVKAMVPLGRYATWFAEWRYYGYGEAFYLYEGFRTNLVTTGVRFVR